MTPEPTQAPAGRPAGKVVLAPVAAIGDGQRLLVTVGGRSIGIFNLGGRFFAFLNRCPHRGAELCKGDIVSALESDRPGEFRLDPSRRFLACPWHGWEFDLETGQSWFDPARTRARPFRVEVQTGQLVAEDLAEGRALELGEDMAEFVDPQTRRIKGPYRAELVPVTVEDDYLVLSLWRRTTTADAAAAGKDGS